MRKELGGALSRRKRFFSRENRPKSEIWEEGLASRPFYDVE